MRTKTWILAFLIFLAANGCGEKESAEETFTLSPVEIAAINSEAVQTLGSIARSQQAYHLEFDALPPDTSNYAETIGKTETANFSYTSSLKGENSIIVATPKKEGVPPHVAFVYPDGEGFFEVMVCKTPVPLPDPIPLPANKNCPAPLLPQG
ncbi:MAG: hypothetical protein J7647_32180 [Cyanobacteria bacterium SBLK]|nr:hypothetical protein [Cyanobacteria bacterium SBLK]